MDQVRSVGVLMAVAAAAIAVPATAAVGLDRVPAGMVVRSAAVRCDPAAVACTPSATDYDLMFVDPADPTKKGWTDSVSIDVDAGSRAMITAYDSSGRMLGVADRSDTGGAAERLTLTGLGDIARVHVSGRGPVAVADLSFAAVKTGSRLPEPATWAMLLSGFVVMAAMIRRRIRLSEASFTERVRQIATGEAG